MSRRHRILAWVKADAQRMKDEAVLAKVTARVTHSHTEPRLFDDITSSFSAYAYGTAASPSFSQRMGFAPFPTE